MPVLEPYQLFLPHVPLCFQRALCGGNAGEAYCSVRYEISYEYFRATAPILTFRLNGPSRTSQEGPLNRKKRTQDGRTAVRMEQVEAALAFCERRQNAEPSSLVRL
jgi:hypothetical protein